MHIGIGGLMRCGGAVAPVFPSANLIHWWKLDEASGHFADSIGVLNSIDELGTYGVAAKWDDGFQFNGTSDYIVFTVGAISATASTVSFWTKKNTQIGIFGTAIVFNGNYGAMFIYDNGDVAICEHTGGTVVTWVGVYNDTTAFHNIALTTSAIGAGSILELFIDGISQGTKTFTTESMDKFGFGASAAYTSYFYRGIVDDIMIWDRVLIPSEILAVQTVRP
jgi:hypothetical protein